QRRLSNMSAEYTKQLERVLRSVAGRLRQGMLRPRLVRAAQFGAAVALAPALVRLATGKVLWLAAAVIVLLAFPLIVLARTLAVRLDLARAASAIDRHYAWQDRLTTAWSSLSVGGLTPLEQFQAAEAAGRAGQVVPSHVVPLRLPPGVPAACGL